MKPKEKTDIYRQNFQRALYKTKAALIDAQQNLAAVEIRRIHDEESADKLQRARELLTEVLVKA